MRPQIERQHGFFDFLFGAAEPIELVAQLARCVERCRDRSQIARTAMQAQEIETDGLQRGHALRDVALGGIARAGQFLGRCTRAAGARVGSREPSSG